MDGVHELVGIDVFAEAFHRAPRAVLFCDQRGAGKRNPRRIGERLEQIVAKIRVLRAVRLVDHQQDTLRGIHDPESFSGWQCPIGCQRFLYHLRHRLGAIHKFMDHHHVHVRGPGAQMLPEVCSAFDYVHLAADEFRRSRELLLQINAVIHQQDFVIRQIRRGAQHPGNEDHCQRFARPLRVPDDTRPFLRSLAGA